MELCQHLRILFDKHPDNQVPFKELQVLINNKLDKDYTLEQIIIGMDYAGFKRVDDFYLVRLIEITRE